MSVQLRRGALGWLKFSKRLALDLGNRQGCQAFCAQLGGSVADVASMARSNRPRPDVHDPPKLERRLVGLTGSPEWCTVLIDRVEISQRAAKHVAKTARAHR